MNLCFGNLLLVKNAQRFYSKFSIHTYKLFLDLEHHNLLILEFRHHSKVPPATNFSCFIEQYIVLSLHLSQLGNTYILRSGFIVKLEKKEFISAPRQLAINVFPGN